MCRVVSSRFSGKKFRLDPDSSRSGQLELDVDLIFDYSPNPESLVSCGTTLNLMYDNIEVVVLILVGKDLKLVSLTY